MIVPATWSEPVRCRRVTRVPQNSNLFTREPEDADYTKGILCAYPNSL